METHKSAEKRALQNEKRRARNVALRSGIKTTIKNVLMAVEKKDMGEATKSLKNAIPAIAKAAAHGAFHKKTASRRISRMTKKVNAM